MGGGHAGAAAGKDIDGERGDQDGFEVHLCEFSGKAPRFRGAGLVKSGFEPYSVLRVFTGFESAARIAWKLTVSSVITTAEIGFGHQLYRIRTARAGRPEITPRLSNPLKSGLILVARKA